MTSVPNKRAKAGLIKIMKKEWIKDLARDLIALGGVPFLVLTIARVSTGPVYYPLEFIASAALFFILKIIFKAESHAGIGAILLIFTSIYYNHLLFTVFGLIVYIGIVISLFYLKKNNAEILKGILLGLISAGTAYFIIASKYGPFLKGE